LGNLIDDGITPLGSGVISKGCWQAAVPGQEFINPVNGVFGDMRQHVTQSGFRMVPRRVVYEEFAGIGV